MASFYLSFQECIGKIEKSKTSMSSFLTTGFFVIVLRNILESFSQFSGNNFDLDPMSLALILVHYTLSYLSIALIYIVLLYFATGSKMTNIIKVICTFLIMLFITPIVDLLVTAGRGRDIFYFLPGFKIDLIKNFFTYCSYYPGITIGIRVEVLLVLCGIYLYCRFKQRSRLISLAYTLVVYSFTFLMACTPIILYKVITLMGFEYNYHTTYMINYYSLLSLILLGWVLFLIDKKVFLVILKDSRVIRIFHYYTMLMLGVLLGFHVSDKPMTVIIHEDPSILTNALFVFIAIFFAAQFAIISNNIFDLSIDRVSNVNRPLVRKLICPEAYRRIGFYMLLASIYFAGLAGVKPLFLILGVTSLYYLYSVPPLRLKRLLLVSKLTISGASLLVVIMGYLLIKSDLTMFPRQLIPVFLIGGTLVANVIDIKDRDGDRVGKILTLPILLGLRTSKIIIGISFVATYLTFYFVLQDIFKYSGLIALLVMGLLQFYVVNQKKFQEWKSLVLHLICMLTSCGYLIFGISI